MDQTLQKTKVRSFVRVAEVWVPEDGALRLAGGDYCGFAEMGETARQLTFTCGEGLPGLVWQHRRPMTISTSDPHFVRGEAARAAGLTTAMGIPVFAGEQLKAVLVILCGGKAEHHGAVELWGESKGKLTLQDGYYGTAEEFEEISQVVSFKRGHGLPGGVWALRTPLVMRDIGKLSAFVRSRYAAAAGMTTGVGMPIPVPGGKSYILNLLSAPESPIARRIEIWDARGSRARAALIDGVCEREGSLWAQIKPPLQPAVAHCWNGPIGRVLGTGLPYVQDGETGLPEGYSQMTALPIYEGSQLAFIVATYL